MRVKRRLGLFNASLAIAEASEASRRGTTLPLRSARGRTEASAMAFGLEPRDDGEDPARKGKHDVALLEIDSVLGQAAIAQRPTHQRRELRYRQEVALYTNLDGTTPDKGLSAILKWQIGDRIAGRRRRSTEPFVTPRRANDGQALAATTPHLTWIGHATFVQRLGGKLIATDPIWSRRIHTIRRLAEPGVAFEQCPQLDIVTVSHAHYDHLDLPTLERIGKMHFTSSQKTTRTS